MSRRIEDSLKKFVDLYASDLSLSEIERLIKRDARDVYDFYVRSIDKPDQQQGPLPRFFKMTGNLFMAFLQKLTPARRAIYSLILLFFVYGFVLGDWTWIAITFILLNVLLAFELADKLLAKDELEVAREIQMSLMPKAAPHNKDFEIACYSEAAREVGGDYYDFIQPDHLKDTTFVTIGDVSGKGMGAALHMVQVQAILHSVMDRHDSPRDILIALNRNLKPIMPRGSFFTISMASYNSDKVLHLCRAGHMPLFHYQLEQQHCTEIIPHGLGVGLPDNGKFDALLEEVEVKPQSGDVLLFYTDGVVESMNRQREEFGDERLKSVLSEHAAGSAAQIQEAIISAVTRFRVTALPNDDFTLIVMKAR